MQIKKHFGVFFAFSNRVAVAFGARIAPADDSVVIKATETSALPTNRQICGGPEGSVLGYRLSGETARNAMRDGKDAVSTGGRTGKLILNF